VKQRKRRKDAKGRIDGAYGNENARHDDAGNCGLKLMRLGQAWTFGRRQEIDDKIDRNGREIWPLHDAEAADFQQAGQRCGSAGGAGRDVDPVIGNEGETVAAQPQDKVGLARSGSAKQQHAVPIAGHAAAVDLPLSLHGRAIWSGAVRKERGLIARDWVRLGMES